MLKLVLNINWDGQIMLNNLLYTVFSNSEVSVVKDDINNKTSQFLVHSSVPQLY